MKNQGKKLMTFRAFSIGFSAALLALACGSDDSNNGGGDETPINQTPDEQAPPVQPPELEDVPVAGNCDNPLDLTCAENEPPTDSAPPEDIDDPNALERAAVEAILAENCGQCHGAEIDDEDIRAGMNYITDLERLADEGKLTPLDSANSLIIQRMQNGSMPPGELEKVSTPDIDRVAAFIDNPAYWDGAAPDDCSDSGQVMDFDELFEEIDSDLSGEDADDQLNYRYLVLTNRFNAGVCADTSLDRDRQALVKMVNMLSISARIEQPVQVDSEGLIYRIDLRDYDWDRAISVNGENFNDVWEAIAANNDYAVPFVGDIADDVVADTGTTIPFMYADTVNDVATSGNLYYAILDIDVNQSIDDYVLNVLQIDQDQNLDDSELIRAGTTDSVLSRQDMVAERHDIEIRNGAYWQRFDFADDQNESIFQDPFGFQEAGREAIFTLPNGLFGYMIADENGNLLEDSDILLDFNQNNFRVLVGQSCSNCHAQGLIPFEDQVRETTLRNAIALDLDADEVELIEDLYPRADEFRAQVEADTEDFYQRALLQADLPVSGVDPVSSIFLRFDLDMRLADAAGDLGMTPDDLDLNLRELNPAVQVLESRTIDRDDFTQFFADSLCILTIVNENRPDDQFCLDAAEEVENILQ